MSTEAEAALHRLAARQHAVFTRAQAIELGVSPATVHRRVDSGMWRVLHRGVYMPSAVVQGWRQTVMAGVLACGPAAYASHRSAAAVWDLLEGVEFAEVSVPHAVKRGRRGLVVHRTQRVESANRDGFRVTPPMRTLVDLAAVFPVDLMERTLDAAHRRGLIELVRFGRYLEQPGNASVAGTGELRRMVAIRDPSRPIDSDLESLFFAALRRMSLPIPVPQHPVQTPRGEKYIDFAYVEHHIGIELDGYAGHGNPKAFDDDRARQNEIEALGWHFFRFTWTQLTSGRFGYVLPLADALGLEPSRWRQRRGTQSSNPGRKSRVVATT